MDEKWKQVRKIFDSALRHRPEDRSDFIVSACEGDQTLLTEVESLLSSLNSAESFLETPVVSGTSDSDSKTIMLEKIRSFGHYDVVRQIEKGGMGIVYLGRDTRLDRPVAIKLLNRSLEQNEDNTRRFMQEAKAASALNHPNILTIYEIGEVDGSHYIVSEYIEGRTLRELIRAGSMDLKEIVDISIQTASALAAAHKARIVHRDIKPENIIVRDDGYVKVLDFGLAKLLPENVSGTWTDGLRQKNNSTASGMILGTVNYMSPEQARGEKVDERTDIFSFGVVIYEMISRKRPFEGGSTAESFANLINKDPEPLEAYVSDLPDEVSRIVQKMLVKDRDDRYQTVRDVSRDLEELRGFVSMRSFAVRDTGIDPQNATAIMPQTTGDNPNTTAQTSAIFTAWHRRWRIELAIVALLALVGAGYWTWHRYNSNWATTQVARAKELAAAGKYFEAFDLAIPLQDYLPGDPTLAAMMPAISDTLSVTTEPAGARVYLKRYQPDDNQIFPERRLVGTTPISGLRIPRGAQIVDIEKEGYAPIQTITSTRLVTFANNVVVALAPLEISRTLMETSSVPDKMVFVPGGDYRLASSSRPTDDKAKLDDYFIDKFEVSNKDYREFVSAGGYAKSEYWKFPIVKDGKTLTWDSAMTLFRDRTSLPGPREWSNQDFPAGKADHPVTGITWYEAAAYAEFRGKKLPTIFQWEKAARNGAHTDASLKMPWGDLFAGDSLNHRANFESAGTVPVDSDEFGISEFGAFNMAGNVSEWVSNEGSQGYFATGGAWGEPVYTFSYFGAHPGNFESAKRGFRCVRLVAPDRASGDQGGQKLQKELAVPEYKRTSDDEFLRLAKSYDYVKDPLDAQVVDVVESADWRREKITFNGFAGKRAIAYLYVPHNALAPLQVVQLLAGSDVDTGITAIPLSVESWLGSVVKSGRAVFAVVAEGASERPRPPDFKFPAYPSVEYRDLLVNRYTDHRRGIDYLETRSDIDMSRIAFVGISAGASQGLILPAVENRYRSVFLFSAGLPTFFLQNQPDANPINFAPHVRVPKYVLNGRFDENFPVKSALEPMMKLFPEPKQLELYDGPHAPPMEVLVPALNRFFDRTLGPVRR